MEGQQWAELAGTLQALRSPQPVLALYGGNRPALILVLRTLWVQYLEYSGLQCPADCAVQGLFTEELPSDLRNVQVNPDAGAVAG